ncbi:hypothetical protein SKAU_G00338950 [Synaphobranchus kaupii]|uniref:Uncharacterized protein n=1 Tax=Synaphobranchus kaupii TaxID=118154 RepID=A0A9Q1EMP7_SYNKA|nr:hypothetical protein SKAU_G00338950 [Synaphobranchus kaupii]
MQEALRIRGAGKGVKTTKESEDGAERQTRGTCRVQSGHGDRHPAADCAPSGSGSLARDTIVPAGKRRHCKQDLTDIFTLPLAVHFLALRENNKQPCETGLRYHPAADGNDVAALSSLCLRAARTHRRKRRAADAAASKAATDPDTGEASSPSAEMFSSRKRKALQ